MTFRVGEVRIAEDKDFDLFKSLCTDDEGWKVAYDKKGTQVLTKQTPGSSIQMCKVKTVFEGLAPGVLYDVLHDEEYRKEWDKNMLEGSQICVVNVNSDICYYSMRVAPLKARDFVMQRSWLALPGEEYVIFNHSVSHARQPPRKTVVRAISLLTGYYVHPVQGTGKNASTPCTSFTYLTQCDPRGQLPVWVVNKGYQYIAPRVAQRLHKISLKYPAWKSKHNPEYKPWIFPEQMRAPRINWDDIRQNTDGEYGEVVDETQLKDEPANGNSNGNGNGNGEAEEDDE